MAVGRRQLTRHVRAAQNPISACALVGDPSGTIFVLVGPYVGSPGDHTILTVGFGLAVAHTELARSSARRRTAVLLSDAVHNTDPNPRVIARRFPELHVLLETDGEHDAPLARDIARLGHGRLAPVHTHRDVAPALNRLLTT